MVHYAKGTLSLIFLIILAPTDYMHYISNLLTLIEVLFHFSPTVIFAIGNQKFIKKRVNPLTHQNSHIPMFIKNPSRLTTGIAPFLFFVIKFKFLSLYRFRSPLLSKCCLHISSYWNVLLHLIFYCLKQKFLLLVTRFQC